MVVTRPPMGWNTWNTFGPDINEKLILESADKMVETGLLDAGYEYVVIDDIWALKERGKDGRLIPNPEKFPHGMKYVADYIHSKGLKFGMYSCAGYQTCAGYPASYEYEWIDAATFAEWEVDFLKYDFCYHPMNERPDIMYKRMSHALANSGRDILFSACSWGSDHTRQWIRETGAHMWRSTFDIVDSWESVRNLARKEVREMEYQHRGCYNDMDMLIVGMNGKGNVGIGGCTFEEYKTHFSLWAMMGSPLMIGCDIRNMTDETKTILMNKDVIAINADPLCAQPFFTDNKKWEINENRGADDPYFTEYPDGAMMLVKLLDGGDLAIGLFNMLDKVIHNWFSVDNIGIPLSSGKTIEMTELWTGEKMRPENGIVRFDGIPPHECRLYRAKIVDR